MDHSAATTKHHLAAKNSLDEGYWDELHRETPYFETSEEPAPPHPDDNSRMKGEFDVLLVNYEDQVAMYKEVKTSRGDLYKAEQQLDRADRHFDDWTFIGRKVLEE